jgi:4-amino-4-deoxy-L-arabinose transferase-like glycosyltransferase
VQICRRVPLSLAVTALLTVWCVGLFARGWWRPDEPREAALVRSMAIHPGQALPRLDGAPFAEKPPLTYEFAAQSVRAFGFTPAATRSPQLVYAGVAFLALLVLTRAMAGNTAALVGGLTFATFGLVYQTQIWLACDALLLAGVSMALLGMYLGLAASRSPRRLQGYLLMYGGLTLAFFAKNFAAWLVPVTALLVFLVWERRLRELARWELWIGAAIPALTIAIWVWHLAATQDGTQSLQVLFWDNLVGRATSLGVKGRYAYADAHRNWPGKYFIELAFYLIPWTAVAWAALRRAWTRTRIDSPQRPAWRFAICATLPSLLILSIAATARGIYAAPCLIGVALSIGLWAADSELETLPDTRRALAITGGLIALMSAIVFTATLILQIGAHRLGAVAAAGLAATAGVFLVAWVLASRASHLRPVSAMNRLALIYAVMLSLGVLPLYLTFNRWQDLSEVATRVEAASAHRPLVLWQPDETTLAWADLYLKDRPQRIFLPDEAPINGALESLLSYLKKTPQAEVLALAPRHSWRWATWITYLRAGSIGPGPHDLSDFAPFAGRGDFHSEYLYEAPGGRRYVLLSHRAL